MASSVYRSARATPRGTTTSTAPHPRHRYRRASTVLDAGPASGSSGPSTSRPRRPWPTTRSDLPGSRLAAPQPGQLAGRTAAQDGGTCAQNLTSIPDWMMRVSLRWIACNRLRRSAAGERWVQPPPATFLSGLHARAFSPARPLRHQRRAGPETRTLGAGGGPPRARKPITQRARDRVGIHQLRCSATPIAWCSVAVVDGDCFLVGDALITEQGATRLEER